jgi:hypothetical protein
MVPFSQNRIHRIYLSEDNYYFIDTHQLAFFVSATYEVMECKSPCDFSKYSKNYYEVMLSLQKAGLVKIDNTHHDAIVLINPIVLGIIAKQYYGVKDVNKISELLGYQVPRVVRNQVTESKQVSILPPEFLPTFPNRLTNFLTQNTAAGEVRNERISSVSFEELRFVLANYSQTPGAQVIETKD